MRFRIGGANWEGRPWKLAGSLVVLAEEVTELHPQPHAADGTVASKAHDAANPGSDHRPKPHKGTGVVRAIDIGGKTEVMDMLEVIRHNRDPRIRYAIHRGRVFSSYPSPDGPAYTWRPYAGPNPHLTHGHVSTLPAHDHDTSPWLPDKEETMKIPLEDWARNSFQWAIDTGIYTQEKNLDKIREAYDFQRTIVNQHRYHQRLGGGHVVGAPTIDLRVIGEIL